MCTSYSALAPKKKLFRYILSASIFKKQHLHLPYRGEKLSFTPFAYRSLFSYGGTFPRKDGQTTKPKSGCSGAGAPWTSPYLSQQCLLGDPLGDRRVLNSESANQYPSPKTNIGPQNRPSKKKIVSQPLLFRGYVSFRQCRSRWSYSELRPNLSAYVHTHLQHTLANYRGMSPVGKCL